MVFIDDESQHPMRPQTNDFKKYLIPNRNDDAAYAHLPVRPVHELQEGDALCVIPTHIHQKCEAITHPYKCLSPQCKWNAVAGVCAPKCDCSVQAELQTRCGRIADGQTCSYTSGCLWDQEMRVCKQNEHFFQRVLLSGLLVPVVYAVCYTFSNKGQIAALWKGRHAFQIAYLCSIFVAACSLLYLIYSVYRMRKYQDMRHTFADPLLTLFVGAMCVPVFRMLWITRDYTKYWMFASLFTTSVGLIWFMSKYFRTADAYKDRLGVISMYYSVFHVVLLDNFVWWWLLFIDSSKK